ncbi:hypothetical protein JHW40_12790 [Paracoccus alcaliphilus]|nr:hypothetical protein JHW40_12790 [Paracoccus alcaliphilus]
MISIRLTEHQKRRIAAAARHGGHPSLSSYALDRLTGSEAAVTDRQKRILIGHLAGHGARLTSLAVRAVDMPRAEIVAELERAATDVVGLQRAIMM